MRRITGIVLAVVMMVTGTLLPISSLAKSSADSGNLNYKSGKIQKTTLDKIQKKSMAKKKVYGVKARLRASDEVLLKWKKKKNVDGYYVYKRVGSKMKPVARLSKKTSYYLDKKARKGRTNVYGVRAYKKISKGRAYSKRTKDKIYVPKKLTRRTKGFYNTRAGRMLAFAKSKIGCRYVSGAAGPRAFDCSGFVYYVCNKAGTIKFPRSSAAGTYSRLRKYRVPGGMKNAQPGDLIFTAYGNRIGHAAIYYGDGLLIHATNPSWGVTITPPTYFGRIVGVIRLPRM